MTSESFSAASGPPGGPAASRPAEAESRARRQLARLRFDLHDGPQQDLILLGQDLRLLHEQLETALESSPVRAQVIAHLEDLQARLAALDADLRAISTLMVSPFLPDESFTGAVSGLVADFKARTSVEPQVTLQGDFDSLSDSQRITLLALIQEGLHNIREHSGARHVSIALSADDGEVSVIITDDGCGFDPETTLGRAVREGHLGILGMHERVQMLGGTTNIDSRPGGPTIISARLTPVGP